MNDPLVFLSPYHGIDPRQGSRYYPRWADHHAHTPFHAEDSQWCSQPYSLDSDALDDFAILRAHGYRIRIDGHSEHFRDCLTVIITNQISAPSRHEGHTENPGATNTGACTAKDQI